MYRNLDDSQKRAASTLFRQLALLAAAGAGFQYAQGSAWDVVLATIVTAVLAYLSVDILKGVKDNKTSGGTDD